MGDSSSMMMVASAGMVMSCGMVCVGGLAAWYLKDPTLGGFLTEDTPPSPSPTCPTVDETWDTTAHACKKSPSTSSAAGGPPVGKAYYIIRKDEVGDKAGMNGQALRTHRLTVSADSSNVECVCGADSKAGKWVVESYKDSGTYRYIRTVKTPSTYLQAVGDKDNWKVRHADKASSTDGSFVWTINKDGSIKNKKYGNFISVNDGVNVEEGLPTKFKFSLTSTGIC